MLIKSILSTEPCVKVRVGMIVVVSEAYYHGFDNNAICKVEEVDNALFSDEEPYIVCSRIDLTQLIKPEHVRIASESEKQIYRNVKKHYNANY